MQAIVEGTIEWTGDHDFGYEIATSVPGVDDIEILQPRRLYERTGRPGGRLHRHGREDEAGAQRVPRVVQRAGPLDPQVDRLIQPGPVRPGPPRDPTSGKPGCPGRRSSAPCSQAGLRPFHRLFADSSGSLDTFSSG